VSTTAPDVFHRDADELLSPKEIRHLDLETKQVKTTKDWLFPKNHQRRGEVPSPAIDGEWAGKPSPYDIVLTAGASCPDVLLDEVLQKIVGWFPNTRSVEEVLEMYQHEC